MTNRPKLVMGIITIFTFLLAANLFSEEKPVVVVNSPACQIRSCKDGKVMIKKYPSSEWTEASTGMALNEKDTIKTDECATLVLEFPDKSSISLLKNTEITIEELVWDKKAHKVGINMSSGELRAIIKKVDTPSEFQVKTPTAICGAKGTIFYIIVFKNGTTFYVDEGVIEYLNTISKESYDIYEGMTSDSTGDGNVTPPRQLSQQEKDQLLTDWGVCPPPGGEPFTEPPPGPTNFTANITQENAASGR